MSVQPEDCPDASSHGAPFRYCGTCTWVEDPRGGGLRLTNEERDRFAFRPATEKTGPLHDAVRAAAVAYAAQLAELVPAGRHRALALTAVQESMLWANTAIAVDTPRE